MEIVDVVRAQTDSDRVQMGVQLFLICLIVIRYLAIAMRWLGIFWLILIHGIESLYLEPKEYPDGNYLHVMSDGFSRFACLRLEQGIFANGIR